MTRAFRKRYRMARAILQIIRNCGQVNGRELRESLWSLGARIGIVPFYHLMNRFEDKGIVRAWYQEKQYHGYTVWERVYAAKENQ